MSDMKIKVILEEANVNKDFFTSNRKENNLKCPFCQQELNQYNPQSIECRNDDCKKSYFMYGSKELWQELIHTRKALDVAVDALKDYEDRDFYDCNGDWFGCACSTAHEALDQITALEQKDK